VLARDRVVLRRSCTKQTCKCEQRATSHGADLPLCNAVMLDARGRRCLFDYIDVFTIDTEGVMNLEDRLCGDRIPEPIVWSSSSSPTTHDRDVGFRANITSSTNVRRTFLMLLLFCVTYCAGGKLPGFFHINVVMCAMKPIRVCSPLLLMQLI
jgi:hypothetical protein